MRRQCELLGVARSSVAYQAVPEDPEDIRIKRLSDEIYMMDRCFGSRRLVTVLKRDHGVEINHKRLQRLRREIGHEAIWCKPRTSIPDHGHRKYPYLLRDLTVSEPDQVWCTDITYVPMPGGHAYLCAVMDWQCERNIVLVQKIAQRRRWADLSGDNFSDVARSGDGAANLGELIGRRDFRLAGLTKQPPGG